MTLELLKQNIGREFEIVQEIIELYNNLEVLSASGKPLDEKQKGAITGSIKALSSQLAMINDAVPELVNGISFYKTLKETEEKKSPSLVGVQYLPPSPSALSENKEIKVAVKKKEEKKFLEKLTEHASFSKEIKSSPQTSAVQGKMLRQFILVSNKVFRNTANNLVEKGYFDSLKLDLRKITSPFVINGYVAMMLFSTLAAFLFGIFAAILVMVLGFGILYAVLALFAIPLSAFLLFYSYPSSKRKSLEKQINQELPFVTIYMAAISTSGIEPSKIFDILASSKDYPYVQRELRKLTNYLNFYGYDLSGALKIVAKNCPSERLGQLFEGFSTAITSGGSLTEFLNKHSETLLFDYRLEREKYTKVAETFMNIYISVVIAAPMIMMMLFILMSLAQFSTGMNPTMMGILTVLAISLLNIGFLVFLNIKQPKF